MAEIKKILLPTDFSGYSNRAFEHALAWAERFGADIHLLHVVTVHNFDPFNPDLGFPDAGLNDRMHASAEEELGRLTADIPDEAPTITMETKTGFSPWSEILDTAVAIDADLIVMATHGRKGLQKLFLGSTTEKVVRKSGCAVLTVRASEQKFVMP